MADFRLGRLKFKWQGTWTASTAYVIDDIVKYGGNTYVCTTNHTSSAETTFYSSDLSNWDLHVEGVDNRNTWTGGVWYKINDIVKYGNTQYRCTNAHTSTGTFDSTQFTVYLEGLNFEDNWVANTGYEKGDIVTYRGYSYVSKGTHSSATSPNADTTNWEVLTTGFSAQGEYNAATAYALGDVVRYGGNSYVNKLSSTGVAPTTSANWTLITEGLNWTGAWDSATVYQLGDVVNRNSNSYVAKASDVTGASTAPELDPNGAYWNYVAQGGDTAQVLQETGDLLYQAASGVNRIALPTGSTGTAAQQAAASGQVLTVGGNPLLPGWEKNNVTDSVYYVTKDGSDTNNGLSISRGFASLRKAADTVSALTGADAASATNPITIFVKSGVYTETLPIVIPEFVSIYGDNLRTSIIKPDAGQASDMQAIVLGASVTSIKYGETVSNAAGTKTAMVLDTDYANNVHIMNLTGGVWDANDKYLDIVGNKNADARDLINSNKTFIASEAYHRHVANDGAVSGVENDVKTRLIELVDAIAFNVKHGGNDKVHDFGTALVGGSAITGTNATDTKLLEYIESVGIQVMRNITVSTSAGNVVTQVVDNTITADTVDPKCQTVAGTITTLRAIITQAITAGNMTGTAKADTEIAISTITTRNNEESTMCLLGSSTTLKELVFQGMSGFVPSASDDKDLDTATIKGVFFRFNPNSSIQKSPYIQNCTIFGGAAVGILLDGNVHNHFNASALPSYKSMVFDAFTQVLDGGVGFYVTNGAATEIVSSFTYYAHISYSATRGGRIRAVTGNSSYGKYGAIARGFNSAETTIDGNVKGKRLTIDVNNPIVGTLTVGERLVGGTSGAVGELINDQNGSGFLYYFPVKGTFSQGETVTGATSGVSATLVNNTDAVQGQKGFILTVTELQSAPAAGGSVELVDNGVNNDSGSFVISNSSYSAPDGRGSLTVNRSQLGTTAAAHEGTSAISLFATAGTTSTLSADVLVGAASPVVMQVNSVTGMTINGFITIGTELFKVSSFPSATSVEAERAQESTSAGGHSTNDIVRIYNAKIASQDEIIEDATDAVGTLRVKQSNVGLDADDLIKIDNEFMIITVVTTDTKGITTLQLADEKTIESGDGQGFKIRYQYSQVRLTAHDFLDVGTGSKAQTNWPNLPLQANVPSYETDESRPGRVYYVSTDQDGNFAVGKYFRVEQSTGKATLDASAFDLSGLSSLRLGSIGAQLGAAINEFSTDGTLSQNSDQKVATQKATKTYVDNLSAIGGSLTIGGNLTVKGTTTSINSVTLTSKDRNLELGKVDVGNFNGDITAGSNQITNVTDTDNIAPGVAITLDSGGGTVTLASGGIVSAVSGTTVTIDQTAGGSGSASGAVFSTGGATDTTADSGGITVLGTTSKTIQWLSSNDKFNFNKGIELASGEGVTINGSDILTETTMMGKSIVTALSSASSHTQIPTAGSVVQHNNVAVSSAAYFLAAI